MEAALPALQASGAPYLLAHGLGTRGNIELAGGNLAAARAALEEGLEVARAPRDPRSVALLAGSAADAARCQGAYERPAELYGECLALCHGLGNQAEIPAILHNQGYVALGQGDAQAAHQLFGESLRRHHALLNMAGVAEALAGLGAVAAARGALTSAASLFGAAEALRARHHAPVWPAERLEVERQVAALRARLPGPALEQHWRAGGALSLEQMLAEAVAEPAERRPDHGPGRPDRPGPQLPRLHDGPRRGRQGHGR